jgi:hypothetical protein
MIAALLPVFVDAYVYIEPRIAEDGTEDYSDAGPFVCEEIDGAEMLLRSEVDGQAYWYSRRHSRARLGR